MRLIHEQLAPRVKGMDILEVERAWQAMFDLTPHERRPQDACSRRSRAWTARCGTSSARRAARASATSSAATATGCPSSPSAATTWKARRSPTIGTRDGAVPRRRHGGLQVQGRRPLAGRGLQAGRSRAQGGRDRTSCWWWTPTAAGTCTTRSASRSSSSRSTSAGSRSRATGTTTWR